MLRNVEPYGGEQSAQCAPCIQLDVNRVGTVLNVPLPVTPMLEEINRRALGPQSVYVIEGALRKGELARAAVFHNCRPTNSVTRQLNVPLTDVHPGRNRTVPSKLQEVAPRAAADFEDTLACVASKFRSLAEPWEGAVSFLFGEVKWCFVPMRLR